MKFAIGIVTVLDQKLFIIFTLLSTGFKNSTVKKKKQESGNKKMFIIQK